MEQQEFSLKELTELGFIQSDAKVYVALLKMKFATPTTLSKSSKIARPRVYDSLKRLEAKGIIIKDSSKKIAKYIAISPDIVLKNIREDLERKIILSKEIEELLQRDLSSPKKNEAFVFKNNPIKIKNLIIEMLKNAKLKIYGLISDTHIEILTDLFDLVRKTPKFENLSFSFLIPSTHQISQDITLNIPKNWKLYLWPLKIDIPFGLIMNDETSNLLIFQDLCILLYGKQELNQFEAFLNNLFTICRSYSSQDLFRETEFKHIINKS